MAADDIVQCSASFVALHNGHQVVVRRGDLYRADDSIVRAHRAQFAELAVKSSRPVANRAQETATAGPGERRSVARPAKVEPKPAAKPAPKSEEDKSDA